MSGSLRPHGLQHTMLPCPSLSLRVCSNSCPLGQWYYLTISSSAAPFFCLQSFSASGSFPMSQLFSSGGQSTGTSTLFPAMNIQGWFPLGLTSLISLHSKEMCHIINASTQKCVEKNWSLLIIMNFNYTPGFKKFWSPECSGSWAVSRTSSLHIVCIDQKFGFLPNFLFFFFFSNFLK